MCVVLICEAGSVLTDQRTLIARYTRPLNR